MIALLAVFAVAKFVLSSHRYVDNGALRLIAAAMLIGAVGPLFRGPLRGRRSAPVPRHGHHVPIVFFLATLAAERQRAAGLGPRRGAVETPRRSFSLLPYVAVAAVDGLLIAVTLRHDAGRGWPWWSRRC